MPYLALLGVSTIDPAHCGRLGGEKTRTAMCETQCAGLYILSKWGRVTSKLYDFINNDDRNTVVTHKLWLGE